MHGQLLCTFWNHWDDSMMTLSLTSERGEMHFTSAWLSFLDSCFGREGMNIMQLIWSLNSVKMSLIFHGNWVLYFFSTPNILIALPAYVTCICLAVHNIFSHWLIPDRLHKLVHILELSLWGNLVCTTNAWFIFSCLDLRFKSGCGIKI